MLWLSTRRWVALTISLYGATLAIRAAATSDSNDYRLFTTPAQRQALDSARHFGPPPEQTQIQLGAKTEQKKQADEVIVRGFVQRDNAANTVWVNDASTLRPQALRPDVYINTQRIQDTQVPVTVDGNTVNLKPGQVYVKEDRRVRESIERVPAVVPPKATDSTHNGVNPTGLPFNFESASALLNKATAITQPTVPPP